MKLGKLKEWFKQFPEEFDDYDIVISEEGEIIDDETMYRLDRDIILAAVDCESKEICLFCEFGSQEDETDKTNDNKKITNFNDYCEK